MIEVKKHCFTTEFNIGDWVAYKKPTNFISGLWIVNGILVNSKGIQYRLIRPNHLGSSYAFGEDLYYITEEMLYDRDGPLIQ